MNKRFHSYEELVGEKQQLEVLLNAQKQVIRYDIKLLKAEVEPVIGFIKKITTKDRNSILLNIGSDLVINAVVKKFILARAGWITRMVIPYFMKNYSSHFLADHKQQWFHKLASWLKHKNGKDHEIEETKERQSDEDVF